ncbi:uncharacterized protein BDR25DRAFT_304376 [Lindgomyces ingoldianus]|uniref:Uncharacterized protein n=1 Tax=Lindgomyces ingoldianus TaxID=673940 RepID=A0ACB6QRQ7_9PLEO|nr:uncharacterized protein BDR25DRAFT_304376 [Lindgomyces ingoldianus]KAF2469663.1 hypothetical protein BDR25DRAFT_304376 [Lindgomyces ingoldianus]
MPQFLDLPREIRDMIYIAIITAERPRPILGEAHWLFRFRKVFESSASSYGEYGCAYALEQKPTTCANFLRCSRQIYAEMSEAIRIARRKGRVSVKLDCVAEDESFHYFTWLAIPFVKTSVSVDEPKSRIIPGWADRMMEKYLTCPHRMLSSGCLSCPSSTTLIEKLWVDIRLIGDRSAKWIRNNNRPDRTSWAVCAAVKRLLLHGPDFQSIKDSRNTIEVDELILNVVTPSNVPNENYLAEDFPTDMTSDGLVHPRTVAKELVDVWNKIWGAADFRGGFYYILIERIKRVRVCINEETWRVRELRLELERGQAERRRIAARAGW